MQFHRSSHVAATIRFLQSPPPLRHLHSFPTRRSSDLPNVLSLAALATCGDARTCRSPASQQEPRRQEARCPSAMERSEEHTSELQSRPHLVCRLLLEKKNLNVEEDLGLLAPGEWQCVA